MIARYNPHALARDAREWVVQPVPAWARDLFNDITQRAESRWQGESFWADPFKIGLPVDPEMAGEYGTDAVRLAVLTSGFVTPSIGLLDSAYRWLACIHSAFQESGPNSADWNPDPWLIAGGAARDHLILRGRPYPALAAVKKAWKQSPIFAGSPPVAQEMVLSLLNPFVPVLTRWLLERIRGGNSPETLAVSSHSKKVGRWPPRPMASLFKEFEDRMPLRVSFDRGGWQWVAVNRRGFMDGPTRELLAIPWIGRVVAGHPWHLEEIPEGWKVCLSETNRGA